MGGGGLEAQRFNPILTFFLTISQKYGFPLNDYDLVQHWFLVKGVT